MTFDPDKIDAVLDNIAKLKDLRRRQGELLVELEASLVAECGKNLEHPKARAAFIAAKEAKLSAMGYKISGASGKLYSKRNGRPLGNGVYDPEAEYVFKQLAKARCYEEHGGCDIDKDTDHCRRCRNPRDTEKRDAKQEDKGAGGMEPAGAVPEDLRK